MHKNNVIDNFSLLCCVGLLRDAIVGNEVDTTAIFSLIVCLSSVHHR